MEAALTGTAFICLAAFRGTRKGKSDFALVAAVRWNLL